MIKTASYSVATIQMDCPHCGEGITDKRDGSFLIHSQSGYEAGQVEQCDACGRQYRVPSVVKRLA